MGISPVGIVFVPSRRHVIVAEHLNPLGALVLAPVLESAPSFPLPKAMTILSNMNPRPNALAMIGAPRLISSIPASGTIDARQAEDLNGQAYIGINQISLELEYPWEVHTDDFQVVTTEGVPAPQIVGLEINGRFLDITLIDSIPIGQWTKLKCLFNGQTITIGYLPGDINSDGAVTPHDLLHLIDMLNQVRPSTAYQCDIDHSQVCAPVDILRLIDLFNANWLGQTLPLIP